ncbi:MAG: hypothetical protein JXA83_05140 [Acidimicrobiales bacterium]|nr:hypothetical protein [Acidimicrobiales bacterium]
MDLTSTESIRLTVPATAAAVRIARAGAAGLATRAGFTYHEVEEVRLAVGEAAALLAIDPDEASAPTGTLGLTFQVGGDALLVEMQLAGDGDRAGPAGGLGTAGGVPAVASAVLDAAVDSWRIEDGGRRIVLRKQLTDTDGDDDD